MPAKARGAKAGKRASTSPRAPSAKSGNSLDVRVSEARRTISSDGYPMSIGELTNLYRDQELIIHPEFQRFFRWSQSQKSRLVESLLLGIPLPSIFVSQQAEGKWELVDGLQRISTILELQGELMDETRRRLPPLTLTATKFLPELEGRKWDSPNHADTLSPALKLDIKRAKVDVKIIKRESSPETKFDLFQRLNSYGSALTAQELRSAMLVAVSPAFYQWLEGLAAYPPFVATTALSERLIEEAYDFELVLRFLVLHDRPESTITQRTLRDFPQFLNDESVSLASAYPKGSTALEKVFKQTFDRIEASGGQNIFRKWDKGRGDFVGPFLNTSYEVFALGLGYQIATKQPCRDDLVSAVKEFWTSPLMQRGFATGRSTEARLSQFIPLGRQLLAAPKKSGSTGAKKPRRP